MNEEKQQIAIAKAHGLFRLKPLRRTTRKGKEDPEGVVLWFCESSPWDRPEYSKIPEYLKDLDAMHRVQLKLPACDRDKFIIWLGRIVEREHRMATTAWLCINATASQRAEAFLRTLNLWEE